MASSTKKKHSRTLRHLNVKQPTGPQPDEAWYDPNAYGEEEEEAEVPLIGEALKAYAQEHSHRTKLSAYHVESAIANLLTNSKLHENMVIRTITREHCKAWKQALLDGTTKRFQGRKAKAWTIDRKIRMVAHFLEWCVKQEYIASNPMVGLSLPKRLVANSKTKKAAFTDAELAAILSALLSATEKASSHWKACGLPERIEFKWIVLCLAFTGARCMEVLQLSAADVRDIEGIRCFDFHRGEGNSLKNDPSIRVVPVHSQLIQAGFLEWAKRQEEGGRLFPLLHPKGSPMVSMWFSRMLKQLGLKRPAISLHSLRHTLTVKLAQARTFPPLENRLLGHAIGKSVEDRIYKASLEFSVKELQEALDKVTLPIDLENQLRGQTAATA